MESSSSSISNNNGSGLLAPRRWSSSDGASMRAGASNGQASSSSNCSATSITVPLDGSMMAVATRIQERARKLRDEQNNLQKLMLQLEEIRKVKEREILANRAHRQRQLTTTIARSQVELDLFRAQDRVHEQRAKNDQMEVGTQAVKEESEKIQAQLQEDIENMYAPHEMEMERYRKVLESKAQKAQKRQEELDKMESNIRRLKQAEKELIEDRISLNAECEHLQREDGRVLQQMNDLSDENQKLLAQRAELRQALREAKAGQRRLDF